MSVCCTFSNPALAHHVEQHGAERWPTGWSFEPWIVVLMTLSAALYVAGVFRLWRHAGPGRGVSKRQTAAYAGGWLALVLALMSPLDALGDLMFSAHMVQHETLMLIAAPLLVLGRPLAVWAWGLPFGWRRVLGHVFHRPAWRSTWLVVTGPLAAWTLHAVAIWLWHLPSLFEAALANEAIHAFQHLTFLFTALLFWWSVLAARTRHAKGIALLSLFTTFVHTGALGALLALSRTDWYPRYAATAPLFHVTALEDQQLGGLVMWIPAGAIYLAGGLALAAGWLGASAANPASGSAS